MPVPLLSSSADKTLRWTCTRTHITGIFPFSGLTERQGLWIMRLYAEVCCVIFPGI